MLYVKNAKGVIEEYNYELVDRDEAEETESYASAAYMAGDNDEESFVLPLADKNITWANQPNAL